MSAFFRDLGCFLGAWFAVALAVRLYTRRGLRRLAATWLVGVSGAVVLRAAIVGHFAADFYAIALGFTALFVAAGRLVVRRLLHTT